MSEKANIIHATALELAGGGVLLMGGSGSGKSTLALALCCAHGGKLVADDRVQLTTQKGKICASLPPLDNMPDTMPDTIKGLCEVRGLGLVRLPYCACAKIRLAVKLVPRAKVPRLPTPAYYHYADLRLPLLHLHGFDIGTPQLIMLALATLGRDGFSETDIYTPSKTDFDLLRPINMGKNIGKVLKRPIPKRPISKRPISKRSVR